LIQVLLRNICPTVPPLCQRNMKTNTMEEDDNGIESQHLEISDEDFEEMDVLEASTTEWQSHASSSHYCRWKKTLIPALVMVLAVVLLVVWGSSLTQSLQKLSDGNHGASTSVDGGGSGNGENEDTDSIPSVTEALDCTENFECLTDRIGHFQWIQRGQALCNDPHRFGLTQAGVLIKEVCGDFDTNRTTAILFSHPDAKGFQMTGHGHFQLVASIDVAPDVVKNENILEEAEPNVPIEPTGQCLSRPVLECPYLHLHKSGDLVLNSINSDGSWSDRKVRKVFPDLFP
jgi:hypothetical protein